MEIYFPIETRVKNNLILTSSKVKNSFQWDKIIIVDNKIGCKCHAKLTILQQCFPAFGSKEQSVLQPGSKSLHVISVELY